MAKLHFVFDYLPGIGSLTKLQSYIMYLSIFVEYLTKKKIQFGLSTQNSQVVFSVFIFFKMNITFPVTNNLEIYLFYTQKAFTFKYGQYNFNMRNSFEHAKEMTNIILRSSTKYI